MTWSWNTYVDSLVWCVFALLAVVAIYLGVFKLEPTWRDLRINLVWLAVWPVISALMLGRL